MTAVLDPPRDPRDPLLDGDAAGRDGVGDHEGAPVEREHGGAGVMRSALASALAAAGGLFVVGGLFRGPQARLVGVAAAVLGALVVLAAQRLRHPAVGQLAAFPLAAMAGALAAGGAAASGLGPAIFEAIRGGGLAQPPVAFDPGWRFLLVVFGVLLGSATAALSAGYRRPRLAVVIGGALAGTAVLAQPGQAESMSAAGAAVFLGAALAVSYDSRHSGAVTGSGRFERARLTRALVAVAVLAAVLVGVARIDALFPTEHRRQVVPPHRPVASSGERDRVLFAVDAPRALPWRLGVLDGYDGRAWLTPPFDTDRFEHLRRGGAVPGNAVVATGRDGQGFDVSFRVAGLGGHVLPTLAGTARVTGVRGADVDPRTGVVRLPDQRLDHNVAYRVHALDPPTGDELGRAGEAPPSLRPFTTAPRPPRAVAELLARAEAGAGGSSPFARLQRARTEYYARVVAAGAGSPRDVTPRRVAAMLAGAPASPFEITAGEALLARWAGIPARIGYGWFGGDPAGRGFSVRPRHGATWLEAWFSGYGWVPIVGTPPQARASLNRNRKNPNPAVRPSDELALTVYVPVRLRTVQAFFAVARFWAVRAIGVFGLGLALVACIPAGLRRLRRVRRTRWARGSPAREIAVAYGSLRDSATDLNIGAAHLSPLEMTAAVHHDDEHHQLAWLVTRALWGDLRRDVTHVDARAAARLAASVQRRLTRAQSLTVRAGAFVSRSSLRDPYSDELPGAGVAPRGAAVIAIVVLAVAMSVPTAVAATRRANATTAVAGVHTLGDHEVVGGFDVTREVRAERAFARQRGATRAVRDGRVWAVRDGDEVQASIQQGRFAAPISADDPRVRRTFVRQVAGGTAALRRFGDQHVYVADQPEQHVAIWFAPGGRSYVILVARAAFAPADEVFAAVLATVRGRPVSAVVEPFDPRRGDGP